MYNSSKTKLKDFCNLLMRFVHKCSATGRQTTMRSIASSRYTGLPKSGVKFSMLKVGFLTCGGVAMGDTAETIAHVVSSPLLPMSTK